MILEIHQQVGVSVMVQACMWECPVQVSAWSLFVMAELFMSFLIPFMQMPECDLGYVTVTCKSFLFHSADHMIIYLV